MNDCSLCVDVRVQIGTCVKLFIINFLVAVFHKNRGRRSTGSETMQAMGPCSSHLQWHMLASMSVLSRKRGESNAFACLVKSGHGSQP
jgi:hypothetical protein